MFDFDYFDQWANAVPDVRSSRFKEYLNKFGRSMRNAGKSTNTDSLRGVHEVMWQILYYPSPLRDDRIYVPMEDEYVLADGVGRDLMLYEQDGPWTIARQVDDSVVRV